MPVGTPSSAIQNRPRKMPGCLSARQRPRSAPKGGFSTLATDGRRRVDGQAQHDLLGTRIPEVLVIFADEFPDFFTRSERPDHVKLPGLRECTWILYGNGAFGNTSPGRQYAEGSSFRLFPIRCFWRVAAHGIADAPSGVGSGLPFQIPDRSGLPSSA